MNDKDTLHPIRLDGPSLAWATAVSLVIAAFGLAFVVLPQAYGIDPTGIGTAMGFVPDPDPSSAYAVDDVKEVELLVGADRSFAYTHEADAGLALAITWNATVPLEATLGVATTGSPDPVPNATWTGNDTWGLTSFTAPVRGTYVITFHNSGVTPATVQLRIATSNH